MGEGWGARRNGARALGGQGGTEPYLPTYLPEEGREAAPLLARHPEYQALASRLVSLYDEITRKALENEKGA